MGLKSGVRKIGAEPKRLEKRQLILHPKPQIELVVQIGSPRENMPEQTILLHIIPENEATKESSSEGVGEKEDERRTTKMAVLLH